MFTQWLDWSGCFMWTSGSGNCCLKGLNYRGGTGDGPLSMSTADSLGQGMSWLSRVNLWQRYCQFDISNINNGWGMEGLRAAL